MSKPWTQDDRVARVLRHPERAGLAYGISAYTLWGVFPLYFHALAQVSPWLIVSHRIAWSALFLGFIVHWRKEWGAFRPALQDRRTLLLLSAGSVLIAMNWFIFIYAVTTGQVLQSSLGYFINPLLSVALGMIFLRERLRTGQWIAVSIAGAAIVNLGWRGGDFPWIALSLAFSFALYGLVRKKVNVGSLHALLAETAVLLPIALALMFLLPHRGHSLGTLATLSASGVITATPLLCFGAAVRRLKLSTIGFLQYIGPSLQFLLAVTVLHEPLERARLVSFVLCWIAIGVYVADSLVSRSPRPAADEPE